MSPSASSYLLFLWSVILIRASTDLDVVVGAEGQTKGQTNVTVKAALLVIDMQDCFVSGGSLAVDGGKDLVPIINRIRKSHDQDFSLVAFSQDWHPVGHVSFSSSLPGASSPYKLTYTPDGTLCRYSNGSVTLQNFPRSKECSVIPAESVVNTTLKLKSVEQRLWPDHCIASVTKGPTSSAFVPGLDVRPGDPVIYKGENKQIDSYSAFFDNARFTNTSLDYQLRSRGITHVFVTGLAADFCVFYTSLDAKELGYETYYVTDATKPVSVPQWGNVKAELIQKGVHLVSTSQLADTFQKLKLTSAESDSAHSGQNHAQRTYPSSGLFILLSAIMVVFLYKF